MSRSIRKGFFFDLDMLCLEKKNWNLEDRSNTILPLHLHKTINVYNGKEYFSLKINKEKMTNRKIGEFSFTKKKCVNAKKQKKELKVKSKK